MKVAAYCRVSTELDDQQNSLKNQKEYFEAFIRNRKEEDWKFAGIYADEGISGTCVKKREAFLRMMTDAKEGKIDLILTKEVSRFARNTVDALIAIRTLSTYGVGVFFILDHIDTRANDGEIRLTLMASMAQEESRKISERVKWGQKRQMEKGVVFGRRMFGYSLVNGQLEINEAEAFWVRAIFEKFVIEGKGTGIIARELNEAGCKTSQGNAWSNVAVKRILENEKYAGNLIQKKTFTPDYLTHKKKKNEGQEEFIIQKNHHEPIVSLELFEAAQKIRNAEQPSDDAGKYRNRYWCSGKIICGACGSPYISRIRHRKDGSVCHTWLCEKAVREGRKKKKGKFLESSFGCDGKRIPDEVLQEGFLTVFRQLQMKSKGKREVKTKQELEAAAREQLERIEIEETEIFYRMKNGKAGSCSYADRYRRTGAPRDCGNYCASAYQKPDTGTDQSCRF